MVGSSSLLLTTRAYRFSPVSHRSAVSFFVNSSGCSIAEDIPYEGFRFLVPLFSPYEDFKRVVFIWCAKGCSEFLATFDATVLVAGFLPRHRRWVYENFYDDFRESLV